MLIADTVEPRHMAHSLGRAIAAYRKTTGMSQAIFAHRTQLTLATVVNLEHGKTWPSLRVLRDLSKFMGWSAEEIGLFVLTAQPLNKGPGRRRKFDERREDAIKAAREAVQKWAGPAATG